jgi:hypothetical protein
MKPNPLAPSAYQSIPCIVPARAALASFLLLKLCPSILSTSTIDPILVGLQTMPADALPLPYYGLAHAKM